MQLPRRAGRACAIIAAYGRFEASVCLFRNRMSGSLASARTRLAMAFLAVVWAFLAITAPASACIATPVQTASHAVASTLAPAEPQARSRSQARPLTQSLLTQAPSFDAYRAIHDPSTTVVAAGAHLVEHIGDHDNNPSCDSDCCSCHASVALPAACAAAVQLMAALVHSPQSPFAILPAMMSFERPPRTPSTV